MATELFIRGRKLNISLVLYQSLILQFQKDIRLNFRHLGINKFQLIIH